MGIEKKSQMEAEEAFKLDVVRVKLVKEAPLYSELPLQNPYEAAATIGELLCEMDREVVCVVNLQSDLKPINVTFARLYSSRSIRAACQTASSMKLLRCRFTPLQALMLFPYRRI